MPQGKYNSIKLWILGIACSVLLSITGYSLNDTRQRDKDQSKQTLNAIESLKQDVNEIKIDVAVLKTIIQ